MADRVLRVVFAGDAKGALAASRQLESGLTKTANTMGSIGSKMTRAVSLPIIAAAAAGINELIQSEKVAVQTAAAIKSTGGAANVTADHVSDLAQKMRDLSGADDEEIQSAQNVLLTFTKVRNEVGAGNDVFDQATASVLNMSVALGKDLNSSAIMVGKALNDPIRGITAMTRAGVQFTDEQKAQIQTLVENNDLLGAQRVILGELETQFGGSAEAAGKTFAGQLNKARQSLEDAAAEIVSGAMPALKGLAGALTTVGKGLSGLPDGAKAAVGALLGIALVTGPLLTAGSKLIKMYQGLTKAAAFFTVAHTSMGIAMTRFQVMAGTAVVAAGNLGTTLRTLATRLAPLAGYLAVVAAAVVPAKLAFDAFETAQRRHANSLEASSDLLRAYAINVENGKHSVEDFKRTIDGLASAESNSAQEAADLRTEGQRYLHMLENGTSIVKRHADEVTGLKKKMAGFAGMSKKEFGEWRTSVADSLGDVSTIFSELGTKAHVTAEKITNAFKSRLQSLRDFRDNIRTLIRKGVSEEVITHLIETMETGGAVTADAMADMSRDSLEAINKMTRGIDGLGTQITDLKGLSSGLRSTMTGDFNSIRTSVNLLVDAILRFARAVAGISTNVTTTVRTNYVGTGGRPPDTPQQLPRPVAVPSSTLGSPTVVNLTVNAQNSSTPGSEIERLAEGAVRRALAESGRRNARFQRTRAS